MATMNPQEFSLLTTPNYLMEVEESLRGFFEACSRNNLSENSIRHFSTYVDFYLMSTVYIKTYDLLYNKSWTKDKKGKVKTKKLKLTTLEFYCGCVYGIFNAELLEIELPLFVINRMKTTTIVPTH